MLSVYPTDVQPASVVFPLSSLSIFNKDSCSSGWPQTCSIAKDDLEILANNHVSAGLEE